MPRNPHLDTLYSSVLAFGVEPPIAAAFTTASDKSRHGMDRNLSLSGARARDVEIETSDAQKAVPDTFSRRPARELA